MERLSQTQTQNLNGNFLSSEPISEHAIISQQIQTPRGHASNLPPNLAAPAQPGSGYLTTHQEDDGMRREKLQQHGSSAMQFEQRDTTCVRMCVPGEKAGGDQSNSTRGLHTPRAGRRCVASMRVCVCVCMYICAFVFIHTHACMRIHVKECMQTHTHTHTQCSHVSPTLPVHQTNPSHRYIIPLKKNTHMHTHTHTHTHTTQPRIPHTFLHRADTGA